MPLSANFLTSLIIGLFAAITPARKRSPYENPPGKITASILVGKPVLMPKILCIQMKDVS